MKRFLRGRGGRGGHVLLCRRVRATRADFVRDLRTSIVAASRSAVADSSGCLPTRRFAAHGSSRSRSPTRPSSGWKRGAACDRSRRAFVRWPLREGRLLRRAPIGSRAQSGPSSPSPSAVSGAGSSSSSTTERCGERTSGSPPREAIYTSTTPITRVSPGLDRVYVLAGGWHAIDGATGEGVAARAVAPRRRR